MKTLTRGKEKQIPLLLTKEEAAYIAGIIDGEGSITFWVSSRGLNVGKITVVNTYYPLMEWLHDKFGGNLSPKPVGTNHRPSWAWSIGLKKSAKLIEQILPYMMIKKQQAQLLLELNEMIPMGASARWHPSLFPRNPDILNNYSIAMSNLNKTGVM